MFALTGHEAGARKVPKVASLRVPARDRCECSRMFALTKAGSRGVERAADTSGSLRHKCGAVGQRFLERTPVGSCLGCIPLVGHCWKSDSGRIEYCVPETLGVPETLVEVGDGVAAVVLADRFGKTLQ